MNSSVLLSSSSSFFCHWDHLMDLVIIEKALKRGKKNKEEEEEKKRIDIKLTADLHFGRA